MLTTCRVAASHSSSSSAAEVVYVVTVAVVAVADVVFAAVEFVSRRHTR
jgi:5,10-methenyltetrahydromethanopterin hydrogenase